MYRLLFICLIFCWPHSAVWAQPPRFGNEWINLQQAYYKIPIAQPGLYRLTATDLRQAGLPITLDPRSLQLFHRGVEQAIWVKGEADGKLDTSDYLEFIGQGNDGVPDSALYRPVTAQPHPYYSLYSDTTVYFLTVRTDVGRGKRMIRYDPPTRKTDTTASQPEPYVWVDERRVFTDQYPAGNIYPMGAGYANGVILSSYDVGEGWMGVSIKPRTSYTQSVRVDKAMMVPDAVPVLELTVVGRTPGEHRVRVQVGPPRQQRTLAPLELSNYDTGKLIIPLRADEAVGEVICTLSPQNDNDEVSLAMLRITYPHQPDMAGYGYREFRPRRPSVAPACLRLAGVPATARLYDFTSRDQPALLSGTLVNGTLTTVVADTARTLLFVREARPVPAIRHVSFRRIDPARVNFALVAHPLTRQSIDESPDAVADYAAYRASVAGGHYDTLTVSIHQLYDQFNYGERSPLAIRRFADYLAQTSPATKHLLLIGRSYDPQRFRKDSQLDTLDMVPNGGWPGSDLSMVTGIAGKPAYVPAMAVGRLNVTHPRQVLAYLTKLKEHEAAPGTAPWRKQMLHLSGGRSAYELALFRAFTDEFGRHLTGLYPAATVETRSKQTDEPTEAISVATELNRGVGILSMFGHSGLDVADVAIGYVSNDRLGYRNQGRYPLLLASGCASGNFYYYGNAYVDGFRTLVSDWVLTPGRGAILALAHTHNGFVGPLKNYADQLYTVLADSAWIGRTFGEIQVEAVGRYLAQNTSVYDLANAEQMTVQGDPAVRPFPFTRPDLSPAADGVRVTTTADSLTLRVVLLNLGRATTKPVLVRFRAYDAEGRMLFSARQPATATHYADTLTLRHALSAGAKPYYEVYADADALLDEERRDNNILRLDATGKQAELPFPVDTAPPLLEVAFDGRRLHNNELVSARPLIEMLLTDDNTRLNATGPPPLELYLQRPCGGTACPFERLALDAPAAWTRQGDAYRLTYQPSAPLPDGQYTLEAYGGDLSGNRAAPYRIQFFVRAEAALVEVTTAPNPFRYQTVLRYTLSGTLPPAPATLRIVDLTGRAVRTARLKSVVGSNEFVWDGTADSGAPVAGGMYLYQLDLPGYSAYENNARIKLTGKLILTR